MKTATRTLGRTLVLIVIFALLFGAGFYVGKYHGNVFETVTDTGTDLKLPTEVEKRVVTREDVEGQLVEIGELSTYSSEYIVEKSVDFTRYLLDDLPIIGTTNRINLKCTGVVKVGYNIADISIRVANNGENEPEGGIIFISLPQPAINDNYLIWDKVECKEVNSILNPIDFEQYKSLIGEIEETGLKNAEEAGIYKAAEDNIKMIITNFLAAFEGYEVEFM